MSNSLRLFCICLLIATGIRLVYVNYDLHTTVVFSILFVAVIGGECARIFKKK